MRTALALFAVVVLGFAVSRTPGATAHPTKACSTTEPGYVTANLSWGVECLHAGEFCKIDNPEYHAYGFDCPASGHLTHYSTSSAPTTPATTTTTGLPSTSTTSVASLARPSIIVLKALGGGKQSPSSGQEAVALARADSGVSEVVSPYQSELGWVAQWHGSVWWLVGVFTSQWGKRFAVGVEVAGRQVHTWVNNSAPPASWIRASVGRWHLTTLFTRLTPSAAIKLVSGSLYLAPYTVLGAAAELAHDAPEPAWYFVFYVEASNGQTLVLPVTANGTGEPVNEGLYVGGYGFGSQPMTQQSVPLNLSDWIRSVAQARGWKPSNL